MNFSRISYLVLSIIIFIFASSIFAQQPDSSKKQTSPLHAGSWSMQFSYSRLDFGFFKGSNISAKYHFTDNSALRFGVNVFSSNITSNEQQGTVPASNSRKGKSDNNLTNIGLTANYIYYLSTTKPVNFFISGGTTFGIGHASEDRKSSIGSPDTLTLDYKMNNKTNSWFVRAEFSAGVEWLVTSNFSIHGEYLTVFMYQYTKNELSSNVAVLDTHAAFRNSIVKSFKFSPTNVLIGVSLYF